MRERGNILFLILLAVTLFAALSYAVMKGERGQVKNVAPEKANAFVAQLLQNANLIENTMMREMTVNGVPEYGFDFSATGSISTANNTCQSANCRIFSEKGGPVPLLKVPDWARLIDNNVSIQVARVINIGTDNPDLVIVWRGFKQEVCDAINKAVGATDINTNPGLEAWQFTNYATSIYTGTLTAFPPDYGILGNDMATLAGKRDFCFQHNGSEGFVYVHVLLAR